MEEANHIIFPGSVTTVYSNFFPLEQIQIMADQAAGRIKIKAAGGIRSLETIYAMQQAGCNRFGIGLSSALTLFRDIP